MQFNVFLCRKYEITQHIREKKVFLNELRITDKEKIAKNIKT